MELVTLNEIKQQFVIFRAICCLRDQMQLQFSLILQRQTVQATCHVGCVFRKAAELNSLVQAAGGA